MSELLAMPREWLAATGEIGRFFTGVMRQVYGLGVFRFFGEALRQSGILIVSSTLVIVSTVFIFGLTCGIEGAYFTQSQGAPSFAGVFTAWCNLREAAPLIFGYIMAAKVGTGIVAELGAMRISEEIDALEVMGVDSLTFLCATRSVRRVDCAAVHLYRRFGVGLSRLVYRGGAPGRVGLLGWVSAGLLAVPEPAGLLIQPDEGDDDGDDGRARGLLLRLQRQWWPCRCGPSHRQVDGAQPRARQPDRDGRHTDLLGHQRTRPNRRVIRQR